MRVPVLRVVATLVLAVHVMPAALPLLCQDVRPTPETCAQEHGKAHHDGAVLTAAPTASSCADSAFCPTHITAVPAWNDAEVVFTPESQVGAAWTADVTPIDALAPLPPPPQA